MASRFSAFFVSRLLALSVIVSVLSCATAPSPDAESVAATFNQGQISCAEASSWMRFKGVDPAADPGPHLERLAVVLTLGQRAVGPGAVLDHDLQWEIEAAERRLLVSTLRSVVSSEVVVSDDELERMLASYSDKLHRPPRVRLRNLFKRVPDGAGPELWAAVRAEIEALREKAKAGADFGELALAESDSQTAAAGGRMGGIRPGHLPQPIEELVFALAEGEVSDVVETPEGFTIFFCEKVIEAFTLEMDVAKRRMRKYLVKQRREQEWDQLSSDLLARAEPGYRLDQLRQGNGADGFVVSFGGHTLSRADALRLLDEATLGELDDDALRSRLEAHVSGVLLAEHARARGLDQEPPLAGTLHWQRAQKLAAAVLRTRALGQRAAATEDEVRTFYDAQPELFSVPQGWDLAVLTLGLSKAEAVLQADLARSLHRRLSSGELSFEEAARLHSDHGSARHGGYLGWHTRRQLWKLGTDLRQAVVSLRPGQLSGIVNEDRALWIVKLLGHREERRATFAEVEDEAAAALDRDRLRKLAGRIELEILDGLDVRITGSCSHSTPKN